VNRATDSREPSSVAIVCVAQHFLTDLKGAAVIVTGLQVVCLINNVFAEHVRTSFVASKPC
jgi:hypothetical protein